MAAWRARNAGRLLLCLPLRTSGDYFCNTWLRLTWRLTLCTASPATATRPTGYVLGPVLGKGGFCSVRKALHELTGQAVACKIIEKGKLKVRIDAGQLGNGWCG